LTSNIIIRKNIPPQTPPIKISHFSHHINEKKAERNAKHINKENK
jgi:hypothetical protein